MDSAVGFVWKMCVTQLKWLRNWDNVIWTEEDLILQNCIEEATRGLERSVFLKSNGIGIAFYIKLVV